MKVAHDIVLPMAEKVEPYRKITAQEIADKTGGGQGLFKMRHRRMKERAAQKINAFRERHINGEVSSLSRENLFLKNPEHQQQLMLVNDLLQKYCDTIGIPFKPVPLHTMRTISKKEKQSETYHGMYQGTTGLIYIDDELRGFELFWTILHEVLHAIGRTTFNATNARGAWDIRRIGYESKTARGKEFSGFNEGVVELIVREIAANKYNEISQKLFEIKQAAGVDDADTSYEFKFQPHSYDAHRSLVGDVIHKEARARQLEAEGETDDDTLLMKHIDPVELQMIHGYFTGNMMHLRSIEKHFGEGSLRFFASLEDTDGYGSERGALFREYFDTLGDEWPTRLRIAAEFIQNTESFALFLRSNAQVLTVLNTYIQSPLPEARTREYEQHIGLACGMYSLFERRLKNHAGPHSRRMHAEYTALARRANEIRDEYMKKFQLNANDVPVLISRPERHLTIRRSTDIDTQ